MNSTPQKTIEPGKPEAYRVSEHARMGTLPRHFGRHMLTVESRAYDLMRRFCPDYDGGLWTFYELSNGGFYMVPQISEPVCFAVNTNGYEGQMTADAAGITVCLFTFSLLSFEYTTEVFAQHHHRLRDFAANHKEAGQIFRAID